MSKAMRIILLLAAMIFSLPMHAQKFYQAYPFDNVSDNTRFNTLLSELRCMVCQNQSLADSDAIVAQDLRQKVYGMIKAGKSDDDIVAYLQLRYGEFILLEPQLTLKTYLLWSGPLLLLLLAGLIAALRVYRVHQRYKVEEV